VKQALLGTNCGRILGAVLTRVAFFAISEAIKDSAGTPF
jgi:hypothetical protein